MIGQSISHYKILEKLGEGGMGVVYKAEDTRLKRTVALKFLPSDITRDADAKERFLHEAQAASALNHPNICGIHTIEEFEGQQFIDMEFVEGVTLREKIAQCRAKSLFALQDAIQYAIQIGEGLNAAHKKGIVHRDIKPDNIMLTDEGLVKIMDFGLAKLKGKSKLTKTHSTLGTLSYMSPEQARGEEADHRSDIFSLGAVLYEMVTGRRPFKGEHEAAIIYSLVNETPEPLARYKSNIPDELQRIVNKALSKERGERYQHVDELLADLKAVRRQLESGLTSTKPKSLFGELKIPWYVYASLGMVVILLILTKVVFFTATEKPITSIAVLPFQNFSKDPEQEYFSDGMTEALISELSKIKALRVISRTSIMRFKKTNKSLPEIAGELGVDAVVEGSVQRVQNDVRITAQLVKAQPEQHLWANDFTRNIQNILTLQSEVAQAIANEIKIAVTPEEKQQLTNLRPVDPEAHEAYLKGRYFIHKLIEADVRKGIFYFEKAIARDSNYALAYAGLAEGYDYLWTLGTIKSKDAFPIIKKYAMKALSIDETLADAYAVMGDIELSQWNFESSERNYKRAVGLNQNYATGHAYYAWYLLMMKRYDEALKESRRAVELDPLWPLTKVVFSMSLYYNHKYDSAMTQVREALSIDSNFVFGYAYLGDFYLWKRNYEEAIVQFQIGAAHGDSSGLPIVAYCYACLGNTTKAREIITDLKIKYMTFHALAYMGLGEWDRTFELFEKAYEEYDQTLLIIISLPNDFDTKLDSLRTDPRFHALVKKMGLEK